jgi:hypothetical protein
MGMNSFAPFSKNPNCFIVQNIATSKKTIRIFDYPIVWNTSRDLLRIPGVDEADIRGSLLKGEINHKIKAQEIVVICSDIDLLQFNLAQKAFLLSAGIIHGLNADDAGGGVTEAEHETLRQLIHFIDNGPGDGFASGAIRITNPSGSPFPNDIVWYLDNTLTKKLVEKIIVYNSNQVPVTITWNMYDFDGTTILHTVVDTFAYVNNVFESSRTRTIS